MNFMPSPKPEPRGCKPPKLTLVLLVLAGASSLVMPLAILRELLG
jgi:hypothetical protein